MKPIDTIRAEMKLAWHSRNAQFLLGVCILPWIFILMMFKFVQHFVPNDAEIGAELLIGIAPGLLCFAFGVMCGVLVWRDEPPKTRAYHWSLPVDTSVHDLLRIVAYGLWLVIGVTIYLGLGVALMLANKVDMHVAQVGPALWVGAYMASFIGFGFGASFSTALNKPVETAIGMLFLYFGLITFCSTWGWTAMKQALMSITFSAYTYSFGSAIVNAGKVAEMRFHGQPADMVRVAGPMILWLAIAASATVLAAYVNRGRVR